MSIVGLVFALAVTTVDLDVISVPLSGSVRISFMPVARGELKREGTITRIKIDVERIFPPSMLGPALNTYVVWAISPEGMLDNLGELEIRRSKGQFAATTRLTQFGILITAEPHYMVDNPNSAVAYRSQSPGTDVRRKTVSVQAGIYDYAPLKESAAAPHNSVIQARAAFQIAQAAGAERLAQGDFRNAQVAIGAMEELVNRAAPLDLLWATANEAIRWSQRAASVARATR